MAIADIDEYPNLSRAMRHQLAAFPDHEVYLAKRFAGASLAELRFAEDIAHKIGTICGARIAEFCEDYRWLCNVILEEELHFRRTGSYRIATFSQALEEVYSRTDFMTRYVHGILLSQLWWRNHAETMRFFRDVFLPGNLDCFSHLEIGPGHGLFLHLAAVSPRCRSAEGWDISDASLLETRATMEALGNRTVALHKIDLGAPPSRHFQSITLSEVLEHVEQPDLALGNIRQLLSDDGRLFLNVPVNSPAPDHIYLFREPEAVTDLVAAAGFRIVEKSFFPCTGATLARARARQLSLSVALVAVKAK